MDVVLGQDKIWVFGPEVKAFWTVLAMSVKGNMEDITSSLLILFYNQ